MSTNLCYTIFMNTLNKQDIRKFIQENKTLRKAKTPAELLVLATTMLYTKAGKISDAFFASFGITVAQYNVLALLAEDDNNVNQLTISQRMLVSPGNITRILDKLVDAKLIKRAEDKQDRRHKCVSLTPKGKTLYAKIKPSYDKYLQRLPGAIPASEQERAAYAMVAWICSLDKFSL